MNKEEREEMCAWTETVFNALLKAESASDQIQFQVHGLKDA